VTAPTPNAALAYQVLDHLDAHPEQWNQRDWAIQRPCGTAFCFAGWAAVLSGREILWWNADRVVIHGDYVVDARDEEGRQWIGDAAREALGIDDSGNLFASSNTREDLGRLVAEIFGPRPDGAS
jgi:hypothetical protein